MTNKIRRDNKKYAVFTVSRKRAFVAKQRIKNPDYPNLRIFVMKKEQLEKAMEISPKKPVKVLELKNIGQYKRILEKNGKKDIEYYKNELEAYKAAYEKLELLLQNKSKVDIHKEATNSNHKVYCFRLTSDAWDYRKLIKSNPQFTKKGIFRKSFTIQAYYVGQTSKSIRERYDQHIGEGNKNKTDWGLKYFIRPFYSAFDDKLIRLFEKETGQSTTGLPKGKSLIVEEQLAEWIRNKNLGAYFA